MGFYFLLAAFGHCEIYSIIVFCHVFVYGFLLRFRYCHKNPPLEFDPILSYNVYLRKYIFYTNISAHNCALSHLDISAQIDYDEITKQERPRFLGDKVRPGTDDQHRAEAEKGYRPPGAAPKEEKE
jgi:hypothetical protein